MIATVAGYTPADTKPILLTSNGQAPPQTPKVSFIVMPLKNTKTKMQAKISASRLKNEKASVLQPYCRGVWVYLSRYLGWGGRL